MRSDRTWPDFNGKDFPPASVLSAFEQVGWGGVEKALHVAAVDHGGLAGAAAAWDAHLEARARQRTIAGQQEGEGAPCG